MKEAIKQANQSNLLAKKIAQTLSVLVSILFLNACSDKYYEMYKSPCACFEDIKKLNQINKLKTQAYDNQTLEMNGDLTPANGLRIHKANLS